MDKRLAGAGGAFILADSSLHSADSVSAVCNFWKEFQLETFRKELDQQGLQVAEQQETSLKSRKKLAEATKDFKRRAPPDAVKEVGPLLKSYQEEIDKLTKRAKFGETAYLNVYQRLYEAPDPAPSLSSALESASRMAELEAQTRKMAQELAEYKAESTELRNQDHTVRRLEERVRSLEAELEEKGMQLKEAHESAVEESNERLLEEVQAREASLTEALAESHASLASMKRLHEASQRQLFAMQSRTEEEQAGLQSELELATSEIDRTAQRLMALEREKDKLKASGVADGAAKQERTKAAEDSLRKELHVQREAASRAQGELRATQQELEQERAGNSARVEGLKAALQAQEAHCTALDQELSTRPSPKLVDDLRQQVRVLQAVGYNAVEADEADADGPGDEASTSAGAKAGQPGSLETLLLDKNRHMEHELTMTRLKVADLTGDLEASTSKCSDLEAQLTRQQQLVARLEEDLLAAEQRHSNPGESNPDSFDGFAASSSGLLENGPDAGEHTMLSALCSQRDRFRERVRQLEEELARSRQDQQQLKQDLDSARSDNVALVERLRFVQGYQSQHRRHAGDVERGEVESKYSKAYEEKINPFTDFRSKERESRRRQMHVADRVMYEFWQFISGHKWARIAVFAYTLLGHVLVFWVLARYSHHNSQVTGQLEQALSLCRQTGTSPLNITDAGKAASDLPIDASFTTG